MKKVILSLVCLVLLQFNELEAQDLKMPQASSGQTITQEFGFGTIKVAYSRPNVKGRNVFGELVPHEKVWRTGANAATVISFSEDIKIEGKNVPAGEYALFSIPGKSEWTIILNKNTKQWGAYTYKESDEFMRFKVKPQTSPAKEETFTIQFTNVNPTSAQMELVWDNIIVPVKLSTEIEARVMANIDEAMKGEKKPYMQAAMYYFETGKDLNKAIEWMNQAEVADQKAPWVKYWKAKMQLKAGDKKGAATSAEAGLKAAKEMNMEEYVTLNSKLLAELKK